MTVASGAMVSAGWIHEGLSVVGNMHAAASTFAYEVLKCFKVSATERFSAKLRKIRGRSDIQSSVEERGYVNAGVVLGREYGKDLRRGRMLQAETLARNQLEPRSSVPSANLMPLGQGSEDSALFTAPQELLKGTYRPQMERPLRTMVSSKVLGQLQEDAFGATDTDAASPPRQVGQRRVSFSVGHSPSKTLKTKTSQVLAEQVFGLVPDAKREVDEDGDASDALKSSVTLRRRIRRIICSAYFECCTMVMILLNSLQIGIQIDFIAAAESRTVPIGFRVTDIIFCIFFTVEVGLRLFVHRCRFFTMYGCAWNIIDLVLVVIQLIEETLILIATVTSVGGDVANAPLMRVVGVMRGIKVIRLIRTVRFSENLQLIVSCLVLSLRTFFWTSAFLFIMIYIMAIELTGMVYQHGLDNPGSASMEDLQTWWGNLPLSMLSLFQALTGGIDWNDCMKPLKDHVSPAYAFFLVLWMAYSYLAIMNLITGTFVESVSQQASPR
ncbi:Scn11a, partial [Symbiodinium microadriaticum]